MTIFLWIVAGLVASCIIALIIGRFIDTGKDYEYYDEDYDIIPAIPINRAVLCMNCETIFNISNKVCPRCGCNIYLNVGLALSDEASKDIANNINDSERKFLESIQSWFKERKI
jgi:uncharacterized paraquat-inducible protein A